MADLERDHSDHGATIHHSEVIITPEGSKMHQHISVPNEGSADCAREFAAAHADILEITIVNQPSAHGRAFLDSTKWNSPWVPEKDRKSRPSEKNPQDN